MGFDSEVDDVEERLVIAARDSQELWDGANGSPAFRHNDYVPCTGAGNFSQKLITNDCQSERFSCLNNDSIALSDEYFGILHQINTPRSSNPCQACVQKCLPTLGAMLVTQIDLTLRSTIRFFVGF